MTYVVSFILMFIGVSLIFLTVNVLKFLRNSQQQYIESSNMFFADVRALLSDPDTPDALIERIKAMNETISDKDAAKHILRIPTEINFDDTRSAEVEAFLRNRPELRDNYENVIVSWFVAITAISPIFGPVLRYQVTDTRSKSRAVKRLTSLDDHNNCGVPQPA